MERRDYKRRKGMLGSYLGYDFILIPGGLTSRLTCGLL